MRTPAKTLRLFRLWGEVTGVPIWAKAKAVIESYVELIGYPEVEEAMIIAGEIDSTIIGRWRYFCAVCRNKHADRLDGRRPHETAKIAVGLS